MLLVVTGLFLELVRHIDHHLSLVRHLSRQVFVGRGEEFFSENPESAVCVAHGSSVELLRLDVAVNQQVGQDRELHGNGDRVEWRSHRAGGVSRRPLTRDRPRKDR